MIRTQVQFTEDQLSALKRMSIATGKSMAELVRAGIDQYLCAKTGPAPEERIARAIAVAGRYSSGLTGVSADHDRYLAEDFL